jgi:hypothetical protein
MMAITIRRRSQSQCQRALLVAVLALPFALAYAQGGASSSTAQPAWLTACGCDDIPPLKDRMQKLEGVKALVGRRLSAVVPGAAATQAKWDALETSIDSYLKAVQQQGLTNFPQTSLFAPHTDPTCNVVTPPAPNCIDQIFAMHEQAHAASCSAGRWTWQTPWLESAMLTEEANAIQAEIDSIKASLDHMACQQVGDKSPAACPQFMVVVQVVTTTGIATAGMNEQSGRSLNNGQGIPVPLTLHDDGTFQGSGTGTDAGSAVGVTPIESVNSQFGHSQTIIASGVIHPGNCTTQPCQKDMMHLVLVGGPSRQIEEAQARGLLNRDMSNATPTGTARLEFDLPAYTGSAAHRTFGPGGIINSNMDVLLIQTNDGTPRVPEGSSLLFSQKECKAPTQH